MSSRGSGGPLILFEGLDFSGKSTVAPLLAQRLRADGLTVVHSAGSLWPSRLLRMAAWVGSARPAIRRWRGVLYTALPIADRLFFRRPREAVTIHEGSVDRMIAFQRVFGSKLFATVLHWIRPHLVEFDQTVVLTASHEERRRRAASRARVNDVDRIILADPRRTAECDALLADLAGRRPRCVVVDTTGLTTDQVVDRIITVIPASWRAGRPSVREEAS